MTGQQFIVQAYAQNIDLFKQMIKWLNDNCPYEFNVYDIAGYQYIEFKVVFSSNVDMQYFLLVFA